MVAVRLDDEVDLLTLSTLAKLNFFEDRKTSRFAQLVAALEAQREAAGISLAELLAGLPEERRKLYQERYEGKQ